MPRSASAPFNYSVPSGTAAVSGAVISSTAYNAFLADLTNNALNASWPIAYGGTGTTDGSALVPDGSAAAPAVRFQQEPSSGFYRASAGDIAASILGTKVLDIKANTISAVNSFSQPYTTTATAAGTTVLVAGSTYYQYFTGVTTQTITLPVASTMVAGQAFTIVNNSTGALTVNSSGANLVATIAASSSAVIQCILASGTTAASWNSIAAAAVANPALTSNDPFINFAIGTPSVAASALTIPFTGVDGNAISATNISYTNFRSATAGSGAVAQIAKSTAQSLVVPSGASLGSVSAVATTYAIAEFNNAGSPIYGIINPLVLPLVDGIATTTLLSGSSTSAGVWYTTTALTSKAYTIIGYFIATEATAGTWATAPSTVQVATSPVVSNLNSTPAVRQTILNGPVTTAGLPNFGGSTGSGTVTATGTLTATVATGNLNHTGTIVNPSWTSLTTNGTMYLYLDVAIDGTCASGSTTLAPIYQWGGTPSNTSGQFTFNIQEMVGYVGSGAAAPPTYRVFVGEVTVSGSVVTAITWYALLGRARSASLGTPASSTQFLFNHNLGIDRNKMYGVIRCITTDLSYVAGDEVELITNGVVAGTTTASRRMAAQVWFGANSIGIGGWNATGGNITTANWNVYIYVDRGW